MSSQENPFSDKSWMYSKPKGRKNLIWLNQWIKLLLEIAESKNIHVIKKLELKKMKPFNLLDDDGLDFLFNRLPENEHFVYWGRNSIRIYWKSLHSWAENILKRAHELNQNTVYGFEGLFELDPSLKEIPKSEGGRIIKILEYGKKIKIVDKKDQVIRIL
jgi:hypothetical protein